MTLLGNIHFFSHIVEVLQMRNKHGLIRKDTQMVKLVMSYSYDNKNISLQHLFDGKYETEEEPLHETYKFTWKMQPKILMSL
jgi:hypothetical protein